MFRQLEISLSLLYYNWCGTTTIGLWDLSIDGHLVTGPSSQVRGPPLCHINLQTFLTALISNIFTERQRIQVRGPIGDCLETISKRTTTVSFNVH